MTSQAQPTVHTALHSGPPRVMLAGNPNSGKTTIFNALTGSKYKVGNYPGVTVEKKEGTAKLHQTFSCILSDLPGIYSLTGESVDEQVAAQALQEKPDLLIVVVDASNIERNLFVVSEIMDLGIPLILALNMSDIAEERGIHVRTKLLSQQLDIPVIKLSASRKEGLERLKEEAVKLLKTPVISKKQHAWAKENKALIQETTKGSPTDRYSEIASCRYQWINKVVKSSVSFEPGDYKKLRDRVDTLATHHILGLFIFVAIMAIIFQSIFTWASLPMDLIDSMMGGISDFITTSLPPGQFRSLIVDGVLAGVGSVIIFVPQIAMLFFFIGLLEDSGYLTRAAFVMDRVMRKVGLQGRSFIPMLSSFACAVPGIMSTRSIPSRADRFVTILVAPLMSCSARLPVYTLLIAAFIPQTYFIGFLSLQGLVMLGLYVLGVVFAAFVAKILKSTLFIGEPALLVMEMPPFRLPSLSLVLRDVWDRVVIFIRNAGTIIFACSIVLWFLASYPTVNSEPPPVQDSYAGSIGKAIEPVIAPLGFDWKIGIGLLASFAAREVFVSTLATVYNLDTDSENSESLSKLMQSDSKDGGGLGLPGALSLLVFYVFACQCMSTLAVCKRETGSWKWPILMFVYMTTLAYFGSLITYRISLALL